MSRLATARPCSEAAWPASEAAWSTLGKKGNDRQRYRKKVKIFFHVSFFGF